MFDFKTVEKKSAGGSKLAPGEMTLNRTHFVVSKEALDIIGVAPGQTVDIHIDADRGAIKFTPAGIGGFRVATNQAYPHAKNKRHILYAPKAVKRYMPRGIYECVDKENNIFAIKKGE